MNLKIYLSKNSFAFILFWHRFNKMLETFLRDFGLFWHDFWYSKDIPHFIILALLLKMGAAVAALGTGSKEWTAPFKCSSQWRNSKFKHTPPVELVPTVRSHYINLSRHGETFLSGKHLCHVFRTGASTVKWYMVSGIQRPQKPNSKILKSLCGLRYFSLICPDPQECFSWFLCVATALKYLNIYL